MPFTISPRELLDMLVMTVAAGYIFMDMFKPPAKDDPVAQYRREQSTLKKFLYSAGLVAPPLILHELGHKFVALSQGLAATFHAAYTWLGIGALIKLVGFPFLVIVPAYVSILGQASPLQHAAIAFAGPGINALLWLASIVVLRTAKMSEGWTRFWQYSKLINGFLFVFNMLPIPGIDGLKVYQGLWTALA